MRVDTYISSSIVSIHNHLRKPKAFDKNMLHLGWSYSLCIHSLLSSLVQSLCKYATFLSFPRRMSFTPSSMLPFESTYVYHSLSHPDSVRILVIESGTWDDKISCKFLETRLCISPTPVYEALSYTWGHSSPSEEILLNGRSYFIRKNLRAILQHLRCANRERFLWVDALCINQDDLLERAQQVRSMPTLYRSATQTLVWLKEKQPEDTLVVEALRLLGSLIHLPTAERNQQLKVFEQRIYDTRDFDGIVPSFHALCSSAWFRRVWVIQEFSVSPLVTFMVGPDTFSPHALDMLQDIVMATELGDRNFSFYALFQAMRPLRTLLVTRRDQQHGGYMKFSEAFHTTSNTFKASDPHDQVFALYGLCHPGDEPCVVDYTLSAQEVFQKATEWCFRNDEIVEYTLALTIENPPREDWPSWVADRSVDSRVMTSYVYDHFSAGGQGTRRTTACVENQTLHLSDGCIVDGIEQIFRLGDLPGVLSLSWQRRDAIRSIIMNEGHYPTGESFESILWRLLIADTVRDGPGNEGERAIKGCGDKYLHPSILDWSFEDIAENESLLYSARTAYMEVMVPQELIYLCRTKKGYFGWVLPEAQEGDQICVFKGFRAPWIVRPVANGTYHLKGSAYVHGIMDGETLSWKDFKWGVIRIE